MTSTLRVSPRFKTGLPLASLSNTSTAFLNPTYVGSSAHPTASSYEPSFRSSCAVAVFSITSGSASPQNTTNSAEERRIFDPPSRVYSVSPWWNETGVRAHPELQRVGFRIRAVGGPEQAR